MKKNYIVVLSATFSCLLLVSGCKHNAKNKKNKLEKEAGKKTEVVGKNVNIPLASSEVKSYFDDKDDMNLGEFVLVEDSAVSKNTADKKASDDQFDTSKDSEVALNNAEDFSWAADQDNNGFKKCHFDFDKYEVKNDEDKLVEANIELAKKLIAEGNNPSIIIEGHSCHAAGSRTYNLVLSEKRAKTVADRFVSAGIPADSIKLVPRGQECPEKDALGNDITGSKDAQWLNRRSEVRVINA